MYFFAEFGSVGVFSPARFLQRGSDGRLRRLGGEAEGEMLTPEESLSFNCGGKAGGAGAISMHRSAHRPPARVTFNARNEIDPHGDEKSAFV